MSIYLGNAAITDLSGMLRWDDDFPVVRESDKPQIQRGNGQKLKQFTDGGMGAVAADADFTLTVMVDSQTQRHTGTLTADRTATLSDTDAYSGATFHIVRSGGGAFNLNVDGGAGTLKALATDTWAIFQYGSSAWVLTAYGAL